MKEKDPKATPKTLIFWLRCKNLMEARILIGTSKETKQHTYRVEPQGLPNLIKKKMMKNLKDN